MPGKRKRPDRCRRASGRAVGIPAGDFVRSGGSLRPAHRVRGSPCGAPRPSWHLGSSSGQVAGPFLSIGTLLMMEVSCRSMALRSTRRRVITLPRASRRNATPLTRVHFPTLAERAPIERDARRQGRGRPRPGKKFPRTAKPIPKGNPAARVVGRDPRFVFLPRPFRDPRVRKFQ